MHILAVIFLIIIIIFIVGVSIIRQILRALFGLGRKRFDREERQNTSTPDNTAFHHKKKIYSKDEGEYIDFEEIKEDKDKK